VDRLANDYIFGENGNGGRLLHMSTQISNDDFAYNREFQRMRYLNEEPDGDDPFLKVSDQQLVDLGYQWKPFGNNNKIVKKSPHFKYL